MRRPRRPPARNIYNKRLTNGTGKHRLYSIYQPRLSDMKPYMEQLYKLANRAGVTNYAARGNARRWSTIQTLNATTRSSSKHVMIDVTKLRLDGVIKQVHTSKLNIIAHKIKVNALNRVVRAGDKRMTYVK